MKYIKNNKGNNTFQKQILNNVFKNSGSSSKNLQNKKFCNLTKISCFLKKSQSQK